jgi:HD-GYP domain-containing protein (c-di-GMP phosphodiesterase class II)
VLAVADVYEALTSERPYRAAMTSDGALETMRPDVPHRLDGDVFGALESLIASGPELGVHPALLLQNRH